MPASAGAHGGGGTVAANDLARVDAVPASGVAEARVLDGDQRLWLRAARGHRVEVLGADGRPFIRISERGVDVDVRSSGAYAAGVGSALPGTQPAWRHLGGGSSFSWHEPRLLPGGVAARGAQGSWRIGLLVDGRRTAIAGTTRAVPAPAMWSWLAALAAAAAATAVALRLREPARARVGAGLALLGAVATAGSLTAIAAAAPQSAGRLQIAVAVAAIAVCAVVLLRASPSRLPLASAVVALVALYLALPLLAMFLHGAVLSHLPGTAARALAAVALAAPVASLALAAPGVLQLVEPGQRREAHA